MMASLPHLEDDPSVTAGIDPSLAPKPIASPVSEAIPTNTHYEFFTDPQYPNLEYHGINLAALTYPTNIQLLTPHEEAGHFHCSQHRHLYVHLKRALQHHLGNLKHYHLKELNDVPASFSRAEKRLSEKFHNELSRRVGWIITPGQTTHPTQDHPATISTQPQDSIFPSINNFIKNYPEISVAATVQDFYLRQDDRMAEHRRLMELRQNWEFWECYFRFHRCAMMLRREFPVNLEKVDEDLLVPNILRLIFTPTAKLMRYYIPDLDSYYDNDPSNHLGTPASDLALREAQFQVLKKIKMALYDKGIGIPLRICPGFRTTVELFHPLQLPEAVPRTEEEAYAGWFARPNWYPEKEPDKALDVHRVCKMLWESPSLRDHYERMAKGQYQTDEDPTAVMRPVDDHLVAQREEVVTDTGEDAPTSSQQLQTASSVNLSFPPEIRMPVKGDHQKSATEAVTTPKSMREDPDIEAQTNKVIHEPTVGIPKPTHAATSPDATPMNTDTIQPPSGVTAHATETSSTPGENDKQKRPKMIKNGSHWSIRGEWPSGLRA